MTWLLLLLLGGIAAAASTTGSSGPRQSGAARPRRPTPETQGDHPHPTKPDNPDAGRHYEVVGASSHEDHVSTHDVRVLRVLNEASGSLELRVFFTVDGERIGDEQFSYPNNCTSQRWVLRFDDGRLSDVLGPYSTRGCPAGSLPVFQGTALGGPFVQWTQEGQWVVMVWSSRGRGLDDTILHGGFFDPELSAAYSIGIDVLWTFTPDA